MPRFGQGISSIPNPSGRLAWSWRRSAAVSGYGGHRGSGDIDTAYASRASDPLPMDRTAERSKGGSTVNIVLYSILQITTSVPTGVGFALAVLALMILSKSAGVKSSATAHSSVSRSYVACIIDADLACLIFNEEEVQQSK